MQNEWANNSWEGIVFHPSLKDARSSCLLRIDGSQLLIGETPDGKKFSLDLNRIQITIGGPAKDFVFIKPLMEGGTPSFSVRDFSILKVMKETGNPNLLESVNQLQKQVWSKRTRFLSVLVGLLLFLIVGLPLVTFYGLEIAVKFIPISADQKLGEAVSDSLQISTANLCQDKTVCDAVQQIVNRLTAQLENSPYHYNVKVVDQDILNAFALPGGQIVIYTGLLKKLKSADEVAGVLSHEIMHVQKRHGLKNVVRSVGAWLILQIIFGDISGGTATIVNSAANLSGLKFGRDMEREADKQGFQLLKKAQFNPSGMKDFFESIRQEENKKPTVLLSTHPLTDERIQTIEKLLQTVEPSFPVKPLEISWQEVQQALAELDKNK
ncbi:MAG: M48 family metallopeptidase [Planctomycetota bacterium]